MEDEAKEMDAGRYVEDAHDLRLVALLHGLVREHDVKWAAEQLGVDVRTLTTCLRRRRLSDRVRVALEGRLQAETDRLAQQVGGLAEEMAAMGERVEALAGELHGALDRVGPVVAQEVGALREEQAEAVRGLERRLAHIEAQRQGGAGADGGPKTTPTAGASEPQRERARRRVYRTTHPKVVTAEPEDGEEEVYGDAEPLVIEWRRARDAHRMARGRLARAETGERELELAIALMEEHGLTLAPERDPWGIRMGSELGWRKRALAGVRREKSSALRQRWLRRVFTLGFWWE